MPRKSKPTTDPISLRFRQIRGSRTQQEISQLVGCQISEWSDYENGKRPGWDNIVKICSTFQLSADWLLFGSAADRSNHSDFGLVAEEKRRYKKPEEER